MASVIEHQKVARRRYRAAREQESGSAAERWVSRQRPRIGLSRTALRGRRTARVRRPFFAAGAGSPHVSTARPVWWFRRPRVTFRSTGLGRILSRTGWRNSAGIFVLDPQDAPLYTAVVLFAFTVNMMLLSIGVDRIVLSGAVRDVTLPAQQELITRSYFSPTVSEFAVLGESAGVDTDRFSQLQVTTYTVRPGDTLGAIALRHDLEMDTLISFNRIDDVRRIQAGSTFEIPDRDGLLYTVRRGDSLSRIAAEHSTTVNAILDSNDLRSGTVREGEVVFVPGARMNDTELRIILGELFEWPMRGLFTSGFGMRPDPFTGLTRFHNGIDLASAMGTPIRAAASGRVVHVESQIGNYGKFVIIRHADGFQTLYAHLDSFSVRNGQSVSRGQQIGRMGNTGRSTGPHLHFSVVHNGTFVNPIRYLH